MLPAATWLFLDAQEKRTAFLREAIAVLGIEDRVEVLTARAEEVGRAPAHRGTYDLVVSRSFGPPAVTIECAAPLLRAGGAFVVSEPPATSIEERWPSTGLGIVSVAGRVGSAPSPWPSWPHRWSPCGRPTRANV